MKSNPFLSIAGSGYQGEVRCTFEHLVEAFGMPIFNPTSDGKTQAEWRVLFDGGVIASIYDYKEGEIPVDQITRWSIGGYDRKAVECVLAAL